MTRQQLQRAAWAFIALQSLTFVALADEVPRQSTDTHINQVNAREVFIAKCAACHAADGLAPLRLDSTERVVRHRQLMRALIEDGTMPPSDFRSPQTNSIAAQSSATRSPNSANLSHGHRALSPSERSVLLDALVSRERTEHAFAGIAVDLAAARAQHDVTTRRSGALVVTPHASVVPASGGMYLRSFAVEVPSDAPRRLRGVRLSPNTDAARSPLRYLALTPDPERAWRVLDESGLGAEAMGDVGLTPSGALGALSRTAPVFLLPKGYAFDLPRGDLVLEATLEPIGCETRVHPSVELIAASEHDTRTVRAVAARVVPLVVRAGERVSRIVDVDLDVDLDVDVSRHRELVGIVVKGGVFLRGFSVAIVTADECRTEVAHSHDFRMNLAQPVVFESPLQLQFGSRVEVTFDLDNTSANPLQPFAPPRELKAGLPPDAEDAAVVLLVASEMRQTHID